MTKTYAILGAGTSGMTFLGQLVQRLIDKNQTEDVRIVLYEKYPQNMATGMPYQINTSAVFLLNGPPASRFVLLPGGKTLGTWMKEKHEQWKDLFPNVSVDDLFPPRALVGHYFKDQYQDIKELAKKHGIVIEERFEEVIALQPDHDSYTVVTKENQLNVDFPILCFGHLPSDNFKEFKGIKNFIPSPYAENALENIPTNESLYVAGGHLSLADTARKLFITQNFQGTLISVTRNPSIVTLRDHKAQCDRTEVDNLEQELNKATSVTWSQFENLFWNAYKKSSPNPIKPSFFKDNYISKKALTYQLAKSNEQSADEGNGDFEHLRDFMENFCIGSCYTTLWKVLDEEGKREFIKHFYSLMVAFVAGIPPDNAKFLLELYETGKIEEKSGLSSIRYNEDSEEFILQFSDGTTRSAKYLVNATGAGKDLTKHVDEFPLLASLIKNEVITLLPWGGFKVNENHAKHILALNPNKNFFEDKPGLSAVFLGCDSAQKWIDGIIGLEDSHPSKRLSCF